MLELICKELDVEFGEVWKNNVGDTYKITEEGLFYMYSDGDWEEVSNMGYKMLVKGELKPIWKPEIGDIYYISSPTTYDYFWASTWDEDALHYMRLNRGLAFKTKKEAIENAKKMLEVAEKC